MLPLGKNWWKVEGEEAKNLRCCNSLQPSEGPQEITDRWHICSTKIVLNLNNDLVNVSKKASEEDSNEKKRLRNRAAESGKLWKEWKPVGSFSQHLWPSPSTVTRDKLLGTEPAGKDAQTERQAANQDSPGF